jgi:hypothetical protein
MALDTTVGGAAANSYASVVEADAYHQGHLYASLWTGASTSQKEGALMMAARLLDANPQAWTGSAAAETQALGWPRIGMLNRNGFAIPSAGATAVPQALKDAQSEFARQLIVIDRTADNAVIDQGIASLGVGSFNVAFRGPSTAGTKLFSERTMKMLDAFAAMFPDAVKILLVPSWLKADAEDAKIAGLGSFLVKAL